MVWYRLSILGKYYTNNVNDWSINITDFHIDMGYKPSTELCVHAAIICVDGARQRWSPWRCRRSHCAATTTLRYAIAYGTLPTTFLLCAYHNAGAWRPRRPNGVQWRCHGDAPAIYETTIHAPRRSAFVMDAARSPWESSSGVTGLSRRLRLMYCRPPFCKHELGIATTTDWAEQLCAMQGLARHHQGNDWSAAGQDLTTGRGQRRMANDSKNVQLDTSFLLFLGTVDLTEGKLWLQISRCFICKYMG